MLTKKLMHIRRRLAKFEQMEKDIIAMIIVANKHAHIGTKTYDFEDAKVEITTKENATLDKAVLNSSFEEWMPINRAYSYTLRTKDFTAMMKHGTPDQRKQLAQIVTTNSAKPVVKIKEIY